MPHQLTIAFHANREQWEQVPRHNGVVKRPPNFIAPAKDDEYISIMPSSAAYCPRSPVEHAIKRRNRTINRVGLGRGSLAFLPTHYVCLGRLSAQFHAPPLSSRFYARVTHAIRPSSCIAAGSYAFAMSDRKQYFFHPLSLIPYYLLVKSIESTIVTFIRCYHI